MIYVLYCLFRSPLCSPIWLTCWRTDLISALQLFYQELLEQVLKIWGPLSVINTFRILYREKPEIRVCFRAAVCELGNTSPIKEGQSNSPDSNRFVWLCNSWEDNNVPSPLFSGSCITSDFAFRQFPAYTYRNLCLVKTRSRHSPSHVLLLPKWWTIRISVFLVSCCLAGQCLAPSYILYVLPFTLGTGSSSLSDMHPSQESFHDSLKSVKIYSSSSHIIFTLSNSCCSSSINKQQAQTEASLLQETLLCHLWT